MTSTNFQVGLTESARSSSKVLKPPGGGSSDIFGSNPPVTPRLVKNHMTSNIFGIPDNRNATGDVRRNAQTNDSHSRLFGETDRPYTSANKNHFKSNIPIGGDSIDSARSNGKMNGHTVTTNGTNGKPQNGEMNVVNGNGVKNDGNPVTGEGYKPAPAEVNTTVPSLNGTQQVINKNRIPPGGFSSGLW